MVVAGVDEMKGDADEDQDRDDLDEHHDVVGAGGFANAAHEDHGEQNDDEERGDVEAKVPSGGVDDVAGEIGKALR